MILLDRISVERGDPGFDQYERLRERRFAVIVLLDGIEQKEVMTADRAQGWIRRYVKKNGAIICHGNRMVTEVVKGKVEFAFSEDRAV